jgi:hypothetical protein
MFLIIIFVIEHLTLKIKQTCIYDDQINQKKSSSKHRYSKQFFKKCVYLVFKFD